MRGVSENGRYLGLDLPLGSQFMYKRNCNLSLVGCRCVKIPPEARGGMKEYRMTGSRHQWGAQSVRHYSEQSS